MSRAPLRTVTPHGTRLRSRGSGQAPLEALAAEFALLAQRRARVTRQLELLERQRAAAAATLRIVDARMGNLAQRMRGAVPDPDAAAAPAPVAPPAAAPRGRAGLPRGEHAWMLPPVPPAAAAAPAAPPAAPQPATAPRRRRMVLQY